MEDITPLNLEDSPKLFGMRYDQLIAIMGSFIGSMQLYMWMNEIKIAGGMDLRLIICLFVGIIGPFYCLVTLNHSANHWENVLNFYFGNRVFIPGPDPNPVRFLVDEQLPEFTE